MKRFRKSICLVLVVMLLVGMTGAFSASWSLSACAAGIPASRIISARQQGMRDLNTVFFILPPCFALSPCQRRSISARRTS